MIIPVLLFAVATIVAGQSYRNLSSTSYSHKNFFMLATKGWEIVTCRLLLLKGQSGKILSGVNTSTMGEIESENILACLSLSGAKIHRFESWISQKISWHTSFKRGRFAKFSAPPLFCLKFSWTLDSSSQSFYEENVVDISRRLILRSQTVFCHDLCMVDIAMLKL